MYLLCKCMINLNSCIVLYNIFMLVIQPINLQSAKILFILTLVFSFCNGFTVHLDLCSKRFSLQLL